MNFYITKHIIGIDNLNLILEMLDFLNKSNIEHYILYHVNDTYYKTSQSERVQLTFHGITKTLLRQIELIKDTSPVIREYDLARIAFLFGQIVLVNKKDVVLFNIKYPMYILGSITLKNPGRPTGFPRNFYKHHCLPIIDYCSNLEARHSDRKFLYYDNCLFLNHELSNVFIRSVKSSFDHRPRAIMNNI